MKKICYLIAITPNIAFAAGNVAIAIDKYMHDKEFDTLIYYTALPKTDLDAFKKIPHVKTVQFTPDDRMVDYLLTNLPSNCPYRDKNKLMLLSHYEVFMLLREYDVAVWLDADILVQGDLSEMLKYGPLGITVDTPWLVRDQFINPAESKAEGYNLNIPGVCTAVIVAHKELPYEEMYDWLIDNTYIFASQMKNIDQVTINLMLQKFGILPSIMPIEKYQCMPWKKASLTAKIVHFGTSNKVWNDPKLCYEFSEWYRNHQIWLELGGSDMKMKLDLEKVCLNRRDKVKKLFSFRMFNGN